MSQASPIFGGRYWGVGSPGGKSSAPSTPDQGSSLLDRINARARARKAAQSNADNNDPLVDLKQSPSIQNTQSKDLEEPKSTENELEENNEPSLNISAGIDNFLRGMRNSSGSVNEEKEDVEDEKTHKKKKKRKNKDLDCDADMTLEDNDIDSPHTKKTRKHKDSEQGDEGGIEDNMDTEKTPKKKKKNKHREMDKDNAGAVNESFVSDSEIPSTKKKKKKKKMDSEQSVEAIPMPISNEVMNESLVSDPEMSSKKKMKKRKDSEETIETIPIPVPLTNGHDSTIDVNESLVSEPDTTTPKKKKQKQRKDSEETIETIPVPLTNSHYSTVDVNESLVSEPDTTTPKKKKKKKQKDSEQSSENLNDAEHENQLEGQKAADFSDDAKQEGITESFVSGTENTDESPKTKKKKKKKKGIAHDEAQTAIRISGDISNGGATENNTETPSKKKVTFIAGDETEANAKPIDEAVKENETETKETGDKDKSTPLVSLLNTTIKNKNNRKLRHKIKVKKKKTKESVSGNLKDFTLLGEAQATKNEKLERTLPHWLAHPSPISLEMYGLLGLETVTGLAAFLKNNLERNKITTLFPVQAAVIPEILASSGPINARFRPRDICVSAPTGSGKTLAYVLPILQTLSSRTIPKIRALVVCPVQELATQVMSVFESYQRGSNLRIGVAVGQTAFIKEQAKLVRQDYRGYHCLVDILVATPGRLLDHLSLTHGLDLTELRFLVLDEADRMLAAQGGGWVTRIEQALKDHSLPKSSSSLSMPLSQNTSSISADPTSQSTVSTLSQPSAQSTSNLSSSISTSLSTSAPSLVSSAPSLTSSAPCLPSTAPSLYHVAYPFSAPPTSLPLQRLLFSATLSHDPEQLQHITLHRPKLFTVKREDTQETQSTSHPKKLAGQFVRPSGLVEEFVRVEENVKPLVLHHLISGGATPWNRVLVFTNSVDSTHRLATLLSLLAPQRSVAEFSSSLFLVEKRKRIISQFSAGKIDILVATDAIARGLDIPDIEHVVSYDVAAINTYVHRIGRTARAGKPGTALSLVNKFSYQEFKTAIRTSSSGIREISVSMEQLEPYETLYIESLAKLKEKLKEEERTNRDTLEMGGRGMYRRGGARGGADSRGRGGRGGGDSRGRGGRGGGDSRGRGGRDNMRGGRGRMDSPRGSMKFKRQHRGASTRI